jgi:hypothetical protein
MATGESKRPNWVDRHPVLGALGVLLGGVVLFIAFASAFGKDTSTPENPEEQRFLSIVQKGQSAGESDNQILVVQARKTRARALCQLLPSSLRVKGWTGTIENISTVLGGDSGVLSIDVGHDIAVQTWDNWLSDLGDDTLIDTDSPLYTELATLREGDKVVFSGQFIGDGDTCIDEQSLLDANGMKTPDFTFRFAEVRKAS